MIRQNLQRIAEKINARHSFPKEFKLKVVNFFYDHDKNCNQTAAHFKVDRKRVGILFIEISTFIIFFIEIPTFTKFFVHITFDASYLHFLIKSHNRNIFAHNCEVIPFRSFQVRTWVQRIGKMQAAKTNTRSGRRGCQAVHPYMEEKLYNACIAIRHQ